MSQTAFYSKCFESFLSDWLLPIVGPYIDPCQYGLKGASISHYLFQMLKFTHEYLDLKQPYTVVVALVDQSKAFNRVSHQMVMKIFMTCMSLHGSSLSSSLTLLRGPWSCRTREQQPHLEICQGAPPKVLFWGFSSSLSNTMQHLFAHQFQEFLSTQCVG